MGRQNKVKQLTPGQRGVIHKMLEEYRTLDEIKAALEEMGADVSRSGLGRYKQQVDKVAARLKESREAAEVIAARLGPESVDGRQGRALVDMLSSIVFGHLVHRMDEPDGEADIDELKALARTIKDMQQSNRAAQDFELKMREEGRREAEAGLKKAVDAAAREGGEKATSEEIFRRVQAIYRGEA